MKQSLNKENLITKMVMGNVSGFRNVVRNIKHLCNLSHAFINMKLNL